MASKNRTGSAKAGLTPLIHRPSPIVKSRATGPSSGGTANKKPPAFVTEDFKKKKKKVS